jgi:hypothetical protein
MSFEIVVDNALTITLALYAALVSTAVFVLEIRRWIESGPRLSISLMTNAQFLGQEDQPAFVLVNVFNRGSLPTTITNLSLHYYWYPFHRYLGLRERRMMVVLDPRVPGNQQATPQLIKPGETWSGAVDRNAEFLEMARTGCLYVGVTASHADKPKLHRIVMPDTDND